MVEQYGTGKIDRQNIPRIGRPRQARDMGNAIERITLCCNPCSGRDLLGVAKVTYDVGVRMPIKAGDVRPGTSQPGHQCGADATGSARD
jgi:hypothetical protein